MGIYIIKYIYMSIWNLLTVIDEVTKVAGLMMTVPLNQLLYNREAKG